MPSGAGVPALLPLIRQKMIQASQQERAESALVLSDMTEKVSAQYVGEEPLS
jgi:hypothetical protein